MEELLSVATLRRLCDELYLKSYEQLAKRYWFIIECPDFPKEISDPEGGTEYNPLLGKGFKIWFTSGGEKNKPTIIFYNLLRENMREHYIEWAENNEKKFFVCILKALSRPIGGKKRKTKRTNRTNKRKKRKTIRRRR